jgi:hypothetical protein
VRGLVLSFVGLLIAACGACEWRRRWMRHAERRVDAEIARNRYRCRKGMDTMDERLRDRTTAKRHSDERAIQNFVRELRSGRVSFGGRKAS